MSTGGSIGSQFEGNMASGLLAGMNNSGSADSTTKAAVSDGTIVIRDQTGQQQDVAGLSRDTEGASPGLDKIFNREKEQRRQQQAQLIEEIGSQAADIARTQGELTAMKKATESMKAVTPAQRAAAEKEWKEANPGLEPAKMDITQQMYQTLYDQALKDTGLGTGGTWQQGISAATAAVQGLAGGNVKVALAGGSAPYLAEVIHHQTMTRDAKGKDVVNVQANLIAHAVLGAVVAQASGNNALSGASGAVAGEYIAQQLYPGVNRNALSEEERQTISALGTLAAGLAGGLAGDSTGSAVAGAQAGKNAVENNSLSLPGGLMSYGQAAASWNQYAQNNNLTPEQKQAGLHKLATGDLPEGANIPKSIVDGYKDGVLMAGAAYLGPAVSVGKVVGGAVIGAIANGTYQWFDLSQPGNENKSYDYMGTGAAAITGGLAPGRGIWQNVGIAAGGTVFTDGPDVSAVGSAAAGAWAGGVFGEYAPGMVNSVIGKELPSIVYDYWGGVASEFTSGFVKDISTPQTNFEDKKE